MKQCAGQRVRDRDPYFIRSEFRQHADGQVNVGALLTGVFDDNGIEAAMASVYRMDSTDLNHLLGQAFARLKEAHGGLLKLRVREGAGALAPGAQRVLVLETRLGDKLMPGHSYHGVIDIGIHGVAVEIQVQKTVSGAPR